MLLTSQQLCLVAGVAKPRINSWPVKVAVNHILTNCSRKIFQNTVQHICAFVQRTKQIMLCAEGKDPVGKPLWSLLTRFLQVTQEDRHTAVGGGCKQVPCQQQTMAAHLCPDWSQGHTSRCKWKWSWQGALLVGSGKMCHSQVKPRTCVHCRNMCHIFPAQWWAIQKLAG